MEYYGIESSINIKNEDGKYDVKTKVNSSEGLRYKRHLTGDNLNDIIDNIIGDFDESVSERLFDELYDIGTDFDEPQETEQDLEITNHLLNQRIDELIAQNKKLQSKLNKVNQKKDIQYYTVSNLLEDYKKNTIKYFDDLMENFFN